MARFLLTLLLAAVLAASSKATQSSQEKNQLGKVEELSQLELPPNEVEQVGAQQIVERVLRSSAREGSQTKGVKERKGKGSRASDKKAKRAKKERRREENQRKRKN